MTFRRNSMKVTNLTCYSQYNRQTGQLYLVALSGTKANLIFTTDRQHLCAFSYQLICAQNGKEIQKLTAK